MVVPTDEAKPDNNKSAVFAEVKLGKLPEIQEEGRRKKKSGKLAQRFSFTERNNLGVARFCHSSALPASRTQ